MCSWVAHWSNSRAVIERVLSTSVNSSPRRSASRARECFSMRSRVNCKMEVNKTSWAGVCKGKVRNYKFPLLEIEKGDVKSGCSGALKLSCKAY